jgi:hypothetical protein
VKIPQPLPGYLGIKILFFYDTLKKGYQYHFLGDEKVERRKAFGFQEPIKERLKNKGALWPCSFTATLPIFFVILLKGWKGEILANLFF